MEKHNVTVEMKMGILHTIAKSIYSSTEGKIREAVANAKDNSADTFIIYADKTAGTLSLFDNGSGITEERFREIFTHLGYGLDRNEVYSLSYFGLGLMSVLQLGKQAKIFTRNKTSEEIILMSADVEKIFDKENEKQSISFLEECINLNNSSLVEREAVSPLTESYVKEIIGTFPENFTEIIIEGVYDNDLDNVCLRDFEFELGKLLPLKPEAEEPFLERIKDPGQKTTILEIFKDPTHCPTITLYFGIKESRELKQIRKYFPDFKKELEFGEANIIAGKNEDFAYYILFATEDLERRTKESAETGFWVRNRNFLVKPADFLQPPGKKGSIIQEPLKNWIYGEIFHKNMNEFLTVSRTDYLWESEEFKKFKTQLKELVEKLNRELRDAWKYGKAIVDAVIKPFEEIEIDKGPFKRVSETLSKMGISSEGERAQEILEKLNTKRVPAIESASEIKNLLASGTGQITIADDDNSLVVIDNNVTGNLYTKTLDPKTKKVKVFISPTIFEKKDIVFLGRAFKLNYVVGNEADAGISIDTEGAKIFVNPFNHDLMKYSVSFLDIYIALELADALAENKTQMKSYVLKLLGREYVDTSKYLMPLSDDLRRKNR